MRMIRYVLVGMRLTAESGPADVSGRLPDGLCWSLLMLVSAEEEGSLEKEDDDAFEVMVIEEPVVGPAEDDGTDVEVSCWDGSCW